MLFAEGGVDSAIEGESLDTLLDRLVAEWVHNTDVKRMLIIPPDHTRLQSKAGELTAMLWDRLHEEIDIEIMPALGTHAPMTREECDLMSWSKIPMEKILPHKWREELANLGEITSEEMLEISGGKYDETMTVEVNQRLVSGEYDLILSIGQVVPHEVIGFANYTKNVCIGAGGKGIIHKSHFLGAVCDMESIMGRADTPVRRVINLAYEKFVRPKSNIGFLLTVIEETSDGDKLRGLYASVDEDAFTAAAELSRQVNMTAMDEPIKRCVVYLDPKEFKSTWLGNKAVYRTRMAMADDGELIVLAPAVRMFGEDATIDRLIRKHGYRGTPATMAAVKEDPELGDNLSAAAHLVHGSSEGRFSITYCCGDGMTQEEIEGVGFGYRPYEEAVAEFAIDGLVDGYHETADGEPFYFIRNPALGLWGLKD